MAQRCAQCSAEVADAPRFCTACGAQALTPATPLSAGRPPMDAHEFGDFRSSLSRGLMLEKDQLLRIRAAASAHTFTCKQLIEVIAFVKAHPVEAIVALYASLSDADANFASVLAALKWPEDRQDAIARLKLDASKYAMKK
jgi:hypothetical protein